MDPSNEDDDEVTALVSFKYKKGRRAWCEPAFFGFGEACLLGWIGPGRTARQVLVSEGPVELAFDNSLQIGRASVAVVDVIGVLPHVDHQQRVEAAVSQRVAIMGLFD